MEVRIQGGKGMEVEATWRERDGSGGYREIEGWKWRIQGERDGSEGYREGEGWR